jgi:hypothetical protein
VGADGGDEGTDDEQDEADCGGDADLGHAIPTSRLAAPPP